MLCYVCQGTPSRSYPSSKVGWNHRKVNIQQMAKETAESPCTRAALLLQAHCSSQPKGCEFHQGRQVGRQIYVCLLLGKAQFQFFQTCGIQRSLCCHLVHLRWTLQMSKQ